MSIGQWFGQLDFSFLYDLVIVAIAALTSIIFHECAHGLVALWLGDDTAKRAKRLTLNPLRHIDPIGLLMLIVAKIGWAKPVPVNPRRFKSPKLGMAVTAAAGPASNLLLAMIALVLDGFAMSARMNIDAGAIAAVLQFLDDLLWTIAIICCGLTIFNLLPIPPLDGSKVLAVLLPGKAYEVWMRWERYGGILLVVLFVVLNYVADITWISDLQTGLLRWLSELILRPIMGLFGYYY